MTNILRGGRSMFATAANRISFSVLVLSSVLRAAPASAEAGSTGQTGLVNMPNARIEEDGTLRIGVSQSKPYRAVWSSVTLLPWFELSGRYTRIDHVPGISAHPEYGKYKDKAFDAKLRLLEESRYLPEVAIGTQDFLGTRLFKANFLALNKRVGDLDLTVGYGEHRINGAFGGVRYNPSWNRNLGVVAEYDANDYKNDFNAAQSGADQRRGGATYAIEYKFGWIGTQISDQHGTIGANVYVSIPLMRKEFIPKIDEPEPYPVTAAPAPMAEQPIQTETPAASNPLLPLVTELERQGFKNVRIGFDGKVLELSLTHTRISLIGRAVGRAARTALVLGPASEQQMVITYTLDDVPALTYRFHDLGRLRDFINGQATQQELEASVEIGYTSPEYARRFRDKAVLIVERSADAGDKLQTLVGEGGPIVSFKQEDRFLSNFEFIPFNLRFFFNDPTGAARYDTFSTLSYNKHFGDGLFLNSAARLTLFEDVSKVTTPSDSQLPHVRTDIATYFRERRRVTLNSLLLNKYAQLGRGVYSRWSGGYYEEMFGGAGGQILYLPSTGNWATDLTVDWLRRRDPSTDMTFTDYSVVTSLAALHYRIPSFGITATARVGRFLAKDDGARFELKRRFQSGVEIGAWYTVTNGNDTTPPGSPGSPYHDKGVFLFVPLNSMLTKDTQATSTLSLAPWTRDVGQMVASPGDLYDLFERRLTLNAGDITPLSGFTR
jgi:Exopolysaccharide biosynthesis protein YbjH